MFIADKVEQGLTLEEIHEEFKEVAPAPKTIWTWKKKYPEFRELMDMAYRQQLTNHLDEVNKLSKELIKIDDELKNKLEYAENTGDPDDMKEAMSFARLRATVMKDRRDNIKVRIDTLKFLLSHVATKLVPELKEAPKAMFNMPSIQIVNYSDLDNKQQPKTRLIEGK